MSTGAQEHVGPSSRRSVGVIGTGAMGEPMTRHLLDAGFAVFFTGRERKYPELERAGASWVDSAADLAARSSVVVSMLPDLPHLEPFLDGENGLVAGATSDLLLMISSTSSPVGVRDLAERLGRESRGVIRVVDAPVSGGEDGARAGTLSVMLGGDEVDTAVAAEVASAFGRPVRLGDLGAGQVAKACNQLVVAATITALGEATVLAERSGVDPGAMWDLLAGGYAGSNILASRRDKLVSGDDSPSGTIDFMIKDLGFATDIAQVTSTHAVLLPHLLRAFSDMSASGMGDRDLVATRRFVSER